MTQINADTATALQKTLNNQETVNSINKMNAAQRKTWRAPAFNFMLGLMKDKELAQRGSIWSAASATTRCWHQAGQFERGRQFGHQRPSQKWRQIADGLSNLAKAGNMKIMPTSTLTSR